MDEHKRGRFLGLPYDWRRPTLARIKSRVWNPDDPRVFTPRAFGWGLDINGYTVLRRLRLVRRSR